jgi:hypothetical protein
MNVGFLHQPPKIHPLASLMLGLICIPAGVAIQGGVGGALIGAGIVAILMAVWDSFRMWMGWVQKDQK